MARLFSRWRCRCIGHVLLDKKETYILKVENSVLVYTSNKQVKDADAALNITRNTFDSITLKQKSVMQSISDGDVKVNGSKEKVEEFMSLFDEFPPIA